MEQVNIHDAKTHFSRLLARAEAGEEIIVARAGKPVAKVGPVDAPAPRRKLGMLDGKLAVPDDIKGPFKDEIEAMFYGNPDKFA